MPASPKEFFETLETRVDPAKAAGLNASYRFDIDGAGTWLVEVDDGKVSVSENGGDADTTSRPRPRLHEDRRRGAEPDLGLHVRQAQGERRHGPGDEAPEALSHGRFETASAVERVALLALTLGGSAAAYDPYTGDIYVVSVAGGARHALTDAPEQEYFPALAPNGRRIAYVRDAEPDPQLWLMNADGSGAARS